MKLKTLTSCLLVLTSWCFVQLLVAEDSAGTSLDSMFTDTGDVENPDNQSVAAKPKLAWALSGSVEVKGGVGFGWTDWPASADLTQFADFSFGASLSSTAALSVRLSDSFSSYLAVTAQVPNLSLNISSFYADYILAQSVFFRFGKFDLVWGNARIFGSTNLPARTSPAAPTNGYAAKVSIPLGVGGINLLAIQKTSSLPGSAGDLGYGISADLSFAGIGLSTGFFYQSSLTPRAFLSAKFAQGDWDIYTEGTLAFPATGGVLGTADAGLYWKSSTVPLEAAAEVFWNGERDPGNAKVPDAILPGGFSSSLFFALKDIFSSPVDFGIQWYQDWMDLSGWALALLSIPLDEQSHFYVGLNFTIGRGDMDGTNYDSSFRKIALLASISLKGSF